MVDVNRKLSKLEIANYLFTYFKLMCCAEVERNETFFSLFTKIMSKDGMYQYSSQEHYNQMCYIYVFFLLSNYYGIKYDLNMLDLDEENIEKTNIFQDIFINKNDYKKFSKKQVLRYIRNAICHNDKEDKELYNLYRNDKNLFIEINLKNTKPIPFHVKLKLEDYIDIMLQLNNSNYSSQISVELPSGINIDNYLDKLEEVNILYLDLVDNGKNNDDGLSCNVRETTLSEEQKKIIRTYMLCYDEKYKNQLDRLMEFLVMNSIPHGSAKLEDMLYSLTLWRHFVNPNNSLNSVFKKAQKYICDDDFVFHIKQDCSYNYCVLSCMIFSRYMLDTVITKDTVRIQNKSYPRNKLRNALTHGRWFVSDFVQLYDGDNSSKDVYNYNWHEAIDFGEFVDFMNNSYKSLLENKDTNFLSYPISFKYDYTTGKVIYISYVKNNKLYMYNLDIFDPKDQLLQGGLYVVDNEEIKFVKDPIEAEMFFNELQNLSNDEKNEFSNLLNVVKVQYQQALKCELGLISKNELNSIPMSKLNTKESIAKIKAMKYGR